MSVELISVFVAGLVVAVTLAKLVMTSTRELRQDMARLDTRISKLEPQKSPLSALPCDIVLIRGHGLSSLAIRFFTRSIGERRTQVNHVGIVVKAGAPAGNAIVLEALHKVRRHSLKSSYGDGRSDVAIYRAKNLTEKETDCIVAAANRYVGCSYGYFKIVLHLLDWILQGPYLFRRLALMDRYPICSWLVAHSYKKAEKNFGVKPGAASPDDIWDFVTTQTQKYTCVRGLHPL